MENTPVVKPIDASSVIVLRKPYEVLLMERAKGQSFLAGASVFPGGATDTSDFDETLLSFSSCFNPSDAACLLQDKNLSQNKACGFFFTAIRELFEESGLLLASNIKPDISLKYRKAIHDNTLTLKEMAQSEDLSFDMKALIPFSRWITPEIEKKRFDTRFFITKAPEGQHATHDKNELASFTWMNPIEAFEKNKAGEIYLMPPTLITILELSAFNDIESLFEHVQKKEIHTIMPEVFRDGDTIGVRLPNDAEYANINLKRTDKGGPTRVVLTNGKWEAY